MDNTSQNNIPAPILTEIETILGTDSFDMWLRPAVFNYEGTVLSVELPSQFWGKTIKERYEHIIKDAFLKHLGVEITVNYIIKEPAPTPVVSPAPGQTTAFTQVTPVVKPNPFVSNLNTSFTFDNFIESPANRFAYRMAEAVVNKLGNRANNPLFIYSTPGLGKTHLLHAIGNKILQTNPNAQVLYKSSEEFVNDYVNSVMNKDQEAFRKKYHSLDCFLMDDIQFVVGTTKVGSEQEFFYTFNALFGNNKQIVLTSDKTPQELQLEPRMSSRLMSGIVAEIKLPTVETRIAILRQKRDSINFDIGDDVLAFIAEGIQTNIRELEGSFFSLVSFCTAHGITPTIGVAQEVLADVLQQEEQKLAINVNLIKKVVGKHFKINMEDFNSKRKTQSITWPRQIAMYLATELTDLSLPEIGREFSRDHSTVVHARDLIKERVDADPFFTAEINQIILDIKAVDKK